MIKTNTIEIADCIDCEGTGQIEKHHNCFVCDHSHTETVPCSNCDGEGVKAYPKWDYDPNCQFCVRKVAHPMWFYLSDITVKRGGIRFEYPQ